MGTRSKLFNVLMLAALFAMGCNHSDSSDGMPQNGDDSLPGQPFQRILVDASAGNPTFATIADLNQDGWLDMIVSAYGSTRSLTMNGKLNVYYGTGDLNSWEKVNIMGDWGNRALGNVKFPHKTEILDIDNDGDQDILFAAGFFPCELNPFAGGPCGQIFLLENTGSNDWTKHAIVEPGQAIPVPVSESPEASELPLFYYSLNLEDLDGDGLQDLLTVGESMGVETSGDGEAHEVTIWFKGTDVLPFFEPTPNLISSTYGGPFQALRDMDGDTDLDLVFGQYFTDVDQYGSFVWLERQSISQWVPHMINQDMGKSFQLTLIPDLFGDGQTRAVGTNHVNTRDDPEGAQEQVVLFDIPADPSQLWPKTVISQDVQSRESIGTALQGAPGFFSHGDVDNDGDIDLVVSGDGDSRVFWYEQTEPGIFTEHVLAGTRDEGPSPNSEFGQAGTSAIVDLDGDGTNEVVVLTYEGNTVNIFKYVD